VLWTTAIPSGDYEKGPRALAWEGGDIDPVTCELTVPDPRVWVGYDGAGNYEVYRLNGTTGVIQDQVKIPDVGGRPYGGAVNKEGDFWMAVRGGPLTFIDGQTLEVKTYTPPAPTYGMGVDKNGDPWVVIYSGGPGKDQIFRFDVPSEQFINTGGLGGYYRGMQVDRESRVWVAGNKPCRLILVDGVNGALVNDSIPVPGCNVPVGISIDIDGFVWMVDQGASTAFKIDPVTYQVVLSVTGLDSPYTYSDMTGNGLNLVLNPPG
jgi:streptogramin lyase